MFINILCLPFLGFLSGIILGRIFGKGTGIITTFLTTTSFSISFNSLNNVIETGNINILNIIEWIKIYELLAYWSFRFDTLTSIMLVVVTFISTLVHLYSTEYMEHDPHFPRFMSYLSLFTFFMIILVTGNSFLQMFIGWEGVGVSSYLLINFWFTRIQANKAAIKAMLVNRIGDFFLLLAMFLIYCEFTSLDYDIVFTIIPYVIELKTITLSIGNDFLNYLLYYTYNLNYTIIDFICLFLFLGAMGKSAQIGLHTWLPDAMEGPTPVSALIHAATMVTAGVFLIIRCSYIFEYSQAILFFVTFIGSLTAFFAATTGLFQNDMKKVIAYSTCSQLGYMVFACGLSSYEVGIFHLSNHAFFKALLFLGAGSVIHAMSDEQDMRKMGGLKKLLPFTYSAMLIGSLALIGFPFLTGFYSKDIILEISASTYTNIGQFAYILGLLAAFCTAFYSTRLLYLVFLTNPNGNKNTTINAHEGTYKMTSPLVLLAILSITIGYLTKDLFIGFGTDFWGSAIYISSINYKMLDIEFLPLFYKLLPLILTIGGVYSAFIIYTHYIQKWMQLRLNNQNFKYIYTFFNKKWYFDRLYNQNLVTPVLVDGYYYVYQNIDRGIIEKTGPSIISESIYNAIIKDIQTETLLNQITRSLFFLCLFIIQITLVIENNLDEVILTSFFIYMFNDY
ncbi:MAG: NADH-quinone oxidoreductase subunit L [Methanobacterium sp.]